MTVEAIHDSSIKTNTNCNASLKLLMYSTMLARDKAWLAGFESAQCNQEIDDNPFAPTEEEYKSWENGWWEGFYNENYTVYELTKELGVSSRLNLPNGEVKAQLAPILHTPAQINTKRILVLVGIIFLTCVSMNMIFE